MKKDSLEGMSVEKLWALRDKVAEMLAARIAKEKSILENRLRQLAQRFQTKQLQGQHDRRPYPSVLPKYRNPDQPSQTWAGRGRQPRWLVAQLRSGKRIEDFLIVHQGRGKRTR